MNTEMRVWKITSRVEILPPVYGFVRVAFNLFANYKTFAILSSRITHKRFFSVKVILQCIKSKLLASLRKLLKRHNFSRSIQYRLRDQNIFLLIEDQLPGFNAHFIIFGCGGAVEIKNIGLH